MKTLLTLILLITSSVALATGGGNSNPSQDQEQEQDQKQHQDQDQKQHQDQDQFLQNILKNGDPSATGGNSTANGGNASASGGSATGIGKVNLSVIDNGSDLRERVPNLAIAALTAQYRCALSFSSAVAVPGAGVSVGKAYESFVCNLMAISTHLYGLGQELAAVEVMCKHDVSRQAMLHAYLILKEDNPESKNTNTHLCYLDRIAKDVPVKEDGKTYDLSFGKPYLNADGTRKTMEQL